MSIHYQQGDLFQSEAEAIVNTVNCVGVMGKGVALEFKKKWPDNFNAYKKLCKSGELRPGHVFIFDTKNMFSEPNEKQRYLVNFPTKDHWRSKSKLSYIESGLDDFVNQLEKMAIKSVALPPLGCGNGGLVWTDVKNILDEKLKKYTDIDFYIYAPKDSLLVPEHESIPEVKMTKERATLVKTIAEFECFFGGYLTRISLQKIVYFFQAQGLNFGVNFQKNTNGPYSEELHNAFKAMDRHNFISNYISEEPRVQATAGALALAETSLDIEEDKKYFQSISRLSLLIQGYESPFGMELLSSVHYLVKYENILNISQVIDGINNWNSQKKDQFDDGAIRSAYQRLKDDGFIH